MWIEFQLSEALSHFFVRQLYLELIDALWWADLLQAPRHSSNPCCYLALPAWIPAFFTALARSLDTLSRTRIKLHTAVGGLPFAQSVFNTLEIPTSNGQPRAPKLLSRARWLNPSQEFYSHTIKYSFLPNHTILSAVAKSINNRLQFGAPARICNIFRLSEWERSLGIEISDAMYTRVWLALSNHQS